MAKIEAFKMRLLKLRKAAPDGKIFNSRTVKNSRLPFGSQRTLGLDLAKQHMKRIAGHREWVRRTTQRFIASNSPPK